MSAGADSADSVIFCLHSLKRELATTFFSGAVLLLTSGLSAEADPCVGPSPFGFGGLQEKAITIYAKKDTPCSITFSRTPWAYFKQTVSKRPRGIYGIDNTIYGAYKPPTGYTGDDYFELILDYQRVGVGQPRFRTTLKMTVKITE
jgi:hypothetical protein